MGDARDTNETREIVCANERAARAEAERQQSIDLPDVEWIYLRNASGQWVARRTLHYEHPAPVSMLRAFIEWVTNPFD